MIIAVARQPPTAAGTATNSAPPAMASASRRVIERLRLTLWCCWVTTRAGEVPRGRDLASSRGSRRRAVADHRSEDRDGPPGPQSPRDRSRSASSGEADPASAMRTGCMADRAPCSCSPQGCPAPSAVRDCRLIQVSIGAPHDGFAPRWRAFPVGGTARECRRAPAQARRTPRVGLQDFGPRRQKHRRPGSRPCHAITSRLPTCDSGSPHGDRAAEAAVIADLRRQRSTARSTVRGVTTSNPSTATRPSSTSCRSGSGLDAIGVGALRRYAGSSVSADQPLPGWAEHDRLPVAQGLVRRGCHTRVAAPRSGFPATPD